MIRKLNNAVCDWIIRRYKHESLSPWYIVKLWEYTGAIELWLDEQRYYYRRGGLRFIKLGRLNISWSISKPKAWVMPKILDLNVKPNRSRHWHHLGFYFCQNPYNK